MDNRERNQRDNDILQSGESQPAAGQDEREFGAGGQPNDDLKHNPGIGQSKGSFATGIDPIAGENTVEGDVDNDSTPTDGVPEHERARTNA